MRTQLLKRQLHVRVTTRPYPVSLWAAAHDANAPAPLPGWRDYLMTDQRHLSGRSMADKEVHVGVEIPARKGLYKALGGLAGTFSDREVAALSNQIRATDEIMASPGMDGAPATPRQLEWLLHRSCSLGLPAHAGRWAPSTMGAGRRRTSTSSPTTSDGSQSPTGAPFA